ncbi:MAG: nitroreductase family protein [Bacillota bacterium]|nr:nitroreductase family protein [Bacillota bacterium]MDD3298418.1 nitroreductase family protein [Bacillota bacterium]MDD3850604.1 nitroreductase family protein [Bacillota bacterium]MDD4707414.1 nitroreductase family protein [Bacillota bacterium]
MTLDELIVSRRSVRQYNEKKVERDKIESLVNAAIWAPTAGNLQLLHFVVVRDKGVIEKVKLFSPGMPKTAPCVIAICADLEEARLRGGEFAEKNTPVDSAFAAQNILLKAHQIRLGACVVKSYNKKSIGRILKLPGAMMVLMLITVGYYDKRPKAPARKSLSEVLHYENWESEMKQDE